MRIAVGGFQHETNTFAPVPADYGRFARADGWPGLVRGAELPPAVDGINLPIAGILDALTDAGATPVPLLWCSAPPSAHVTEDAFERIAEAMCAELRAAIAEDGPVDGVCLDLHGAMVAEHLEDGEGELLARLRAVVGPEVPITASLDLHANVTDAMLAGADALDIYRTYPHVDMAATGQRAAGHLLAMLESGRRPARALRKADFLIPLNWGCTDIAPMDALYGEVLPALLRDTPGLRGLCLACGFPQADIYEVGPAVLAYADDPATAEQAADALMTVLAERAPDFGEPIFDAEGAVAEAVRLRAVPGADARPVVIADTQDNPGGGGPGDTTGMLRALLAAGEPAAGAVLAMLIDPDSAEAAHAAGTGATGRFTLGGRRYPGDSPVEASARVLALGDGRFTATGPMWHGARMDLGPMALLDVEGVRVILAAREMQAGDQAMFRHLGLEPAELPIVVLKSSVHFRADFAPIAAAVLTAAAPGPVTADPASLAYRNIREGVRRRPDLQETQASI